MSQLLKSFNVPPLQKSIDHYKELGNGSGKKIDKGGWGRGWGSGGRYSKSNVYLAIIKEESWECSIMSIHEHVRHAMLFSNLRGVFIFSSNVSENIEE